MITTDADGRPARPLRHGVYFRLSKFRIAVLAILFVLPWGFVFRKALAKLASAEHHSAAATQPVVLAALHPSSHLATTTTSSSPQWGELTITRINVEPPADLATRFANVD